MDSKCFMFDLVILNVWLPDFDFGSHPLSIEVVFNGTEFTVEDDPEKPGEFKQGRTCEFSACPVELKNELLDRPLKLKVTSSENVLGQAEVNWPQELLDKLESKCFMEYSHFDQCDIRLDNMTTGKVDIQYRWRAKCELSDVEDEEEEERTCDIQDVLNRVVQPNELFFVIQNDSDACSGAVEKKKQCPTALDLSRFKNFHGKIVKDPAVFDQVYSLDCCHTKMYPEDRQKSSVHRNQTPTCPRLQNNPTKCDTSKDSIEWACKAKQHVAECPHSNKFSDETTGSCSCDCDRCAIKTGIFENGKIKNICGHLPESPPVLTENIYIRPKLCPVCNSDVSWLPKLAACPKCGHKPTPYVVEKPYNENLTADQILEEWAVDIPKSKSNKSDGPKRTNRCACKNGKVCPYCRIRNLCKDMLKTKKCNDPCIRSTESEVKELSPEEICKTNSETESRTYLARVFSELRDLYNLKLDKKKRGFELNKACEKEFRELDVPEKKFKKIKETKTDMAKTLTPENKANFCKGKLYNYKAIRKYPGTLIGHKHCVSTNQSVPRNMGWLWNTDIVGNRRGWKPGAIRKPIKELMKYFLKDFPVDQLPVSRYSRKKLVQKESEELVQKPTLHIFKKNGAYIITMRPLKDSSVLGKCANPYVPMKPIRFKIVKNPLLVHASEMKKSLKTQFSKCICHKPVSSCYCRTYLDKKRLEFELNKACRQKGIPSLKDTLVLSDTSDSEMELDFGVTPPAGVIKPQLKHRPDLVCRETQYNEKDWAIKPYFPMRVNKYMRAFDASGGRGAPGAYVGLKEPSGVSERGGSFGAQGRGSGGRFGTGSAGRGGGHSGSGPVNRTGGQFGGGPVSRGGGPLGGSRGGGPVGFTAGRDADAGGGDRTAVVRAAGPRAVRGGRDGGPGGGVSGAPGGVGGWGGVGGNIGGSVVRGGMASGKGGTIPPPLFCNLARRRKADPCGCGPPPCKPCVPIC